MGNYEPPVIREGCEVAETLGDSAGDPSKIRGTLKPKILLIGKNGQVGSALVACLPQLGEVIALDRHQLDLMNPGDIRDAIRKVHPTLIVNAAAYTAVDLAETENCDSRSHQCHSARDHSRRSKNNWRWGCSLLYGLYIRWAQDFPL